MDASNNSIAIQKYLLTEKHKCITHVTVVQTVQ